MLSLGSVTMARMQGVGLMAVLIMAVVGGDALAAQAVGNPMCATSSLRIGVADNEAAAGTHLLAISYKNVTRATCRTGGFPGVTLYGPAGDQLAIAKRGTSRRAPQLLIRSGKRVYGVIAYGQAPVARQRCPAVTAVGIYAPNSRRSTRIKLHQPGQYCGGAEVYPLATSPRKSLNG